LLITFLALCALLTMATSANAVVTWDAETYWGPTVLQPGDGAGPEGGVTIEVGNAGDETATDWPTVTVTLPPGVTYATNETDFFSWSCSGGQTVTCTPSPFASLFLGPPLAHTMAGGQLGAVRAAFTVDVAPDAALGTQSLTVEIAGGGATTSTTIPYDVQVGGQPADFGPIDGSFVSGARDASGADEIRAGVKPHDIVTGFVTTKEFRDPGVTGSWGEIVVPLGNIKDVVVDLPAGFVGNPQAVATCPKSAVKLNDCPQSSQVGIAEANNIAAPQLQLSAIYNVVPNGDAPAQFMFDTGGGPVLLTPRLRSDGNWGINVDARNLTEANPLFAAEVTLWGDPADPVHDHQRCALPSHVGDTCAGHNSGGSNPGEDIHLPHSSSISRRPFLRNPTRCNGTPDVVTMHLSPWQAPAAFEPDGDPDLSDPLWDTSTDSTPPLTNCDALQFLPEIDVKTTNSKAGGASGFEFKLTLPQNDDIDGLATAHMRNATVTLPPGTRVNPGSADGLDSCSSAEIGLTDTSPIRFTKTEPTCPLKSKIGTVEIDTPLLADPLAGDVYLAAQGDHPFDTLVAIYIVVRGPGIVGKLAGRVDLDGGLVKTTVIDNPQVPFETLTVKLKSGDRGALTVPSTCGPHDVTAEFTSWAGHDVTKTDGFNVACPGNAGVFAPTFTAGTADPVAGASSPMRIRMTRDSGTKEFGRLEMKLPTGLLASPKYVDLCTEAELAPAQNPAGSPGNPPGRFTQVTPSCPPTSQIGTTTVGVGSGTTPFFPLIPGTGHIGRVFLTGTHHGTDLPQPGKRQTAYGVAIEVPAVAGPFDLGTVLVRGALYADPTTAELTAISDKLPAELQGVPLNARDIRVDIDRENFSRNPTSCEEKHILADIAAQDGTTVERSTRFEVGECAALKFKPRIGLRLTGRKQMTSEKHPGIKAVFRQGLGEAGVKKAKVTLPGTLALDSDNAQSLCEFVDGTKPDLENHCPAGSIVGRGRATSPLLKRPLSGNVYFVKNVRIDPDTGNPIRTLPMIVVALRGEIAVNLKGESATSANGRLVSTFAAVPDAPVSQFNLNIKGGKNGIILVTENRRGRINICKAGKQIAEADTDAQSGKRRDFNIKVKTPCKKPKKSKKSKRR
jgi:hypothetical protein